MIPQPVLVESRRKAEAMGETLPKSRVAAATILVLWSVGIFFLAIYLLRIFWL
jgi:hypothetical protein